MFDDFMPASRVGVSLGGRQTCAHRCRHLACCGFQRKNSDFMEGLFPETQSPGNSCSRFFKVPRHCLQFFCRGTVYCGRGGGNRELLHKWFISVDVDLNGIITIFEAAVLWLRKTKTRKQAQTHYHDYRVHNT